MERFTGRLPIPGNVHLIRAFADTARYLVLAGAAGCDGFGCGTVYPIARARAEQVLYRFKGGSDGELPSGTFVDVNGTLYGTTGFGGVVTGCDGNGCGTVYSITTTGTKSILYSFPGKPNGNGPEAALLYLKGKLYGTTVAGGGGSCGRFGCGTIFALSL